MSLADKIIANSEEARRRESPWGPLDEYGFPLVHKDKLDYTVARIIIRNQGLCINPQDMRIYNLDDRSLGLPRPIEENATSIVSLSGFDSPFARGAKKVLVFDRLKGLLPEADMDSIEICDGLILDGKTKTLKKVPTRAEVDAHYKSLTALKNLNERKK